MLDDLEKRSKKDISVFNRKGDISRSSVRKGKILSTGVGRGLLRHVKKHPRKGHEWKEGRNSTKKEEESDEKSRFSEDRSVSMKKGAVHSMEGGKYTSSRLRTRRGKQSRERGSDSISVRSHQKRQDSQGRTHASLKPLVKIKNEIVPSILKPR